MHNAAGPDGPIPNESRFSASLIAVTALNIATGTATHVVVFLLMGASGATDAYYAGQTIPAVIFSLVGAGLTRVLVPILQSAGDRRQRVLWGSTSIVAGSFAGLTLLLFLTATHWVRILFNGFDPETSSLAVTLSQIQCWNLLFMAIAATLTAGYHARNRFHVVEAATTAVGVASLVMLPFLLPRFGIAAAAWLFTGRAIVLCVILTPILGRPIGWKWSDPELRMSRERLIPMVPGAIAFRLGPVIERWLASYTPPGALTLLNLIQQGFVALLSVGDRSIGAVLTSRASQHLLRGNPADAMLLYGLTVRRLLLAAVAFYAAIGGAVLATAPWWSTWKQIGPAHHGTLLPLTLILGLTLPGGGVGQAALSVLYALGETRRIAAIALTGLAVSAAARVLGFLQFGLYGLAAGIALHQILNALLLHGALQKRLRARVASGATVICAPGIEQDR